MEQSNQYFQKAFDILSELPDKSMQEKQMLIDVVIKWVFVFYYIGDAYKWTEILSSHEHIAETLDESETLGMFYAWYGFALTCRDKPNEAYQYLLKSLKIGEEISNQKVIGYASCWLSWTCARLGFLEEGINCGKRGQEISELFIEDHYLFFKSLAGMAYNYESTGNIRNIFEIGRDLLDYGEKHSSTRCLVAGHMGIGQGYFCSGKLPQALDSFKNAADVSADPMYGYWAQIYIGICYFSMGNIQEAGKFLNEVDSFGIELGHEMLGHPARTLSGGILMAKGEMSKGLKLIEKTNEEYSETNQKTMIVYSEQLLGKIFLQIAEGAGPINLKLIIKNIGFLIRYAPSAAKRAERHLNNAIRIAKEIGAKFYLALAYYDLGLLYKAKKKDDLAKENIAGAIKIFEQCEAEELVKQAKNKLESLS